MWDVKHSLQLVPCCALLLLVACSDAAPLAIPVPGELPAAAAPDTPPSDGGDGAVSQAPQSGADAAASCSSGSYWSEGNDGDRAMNPGLPCIACHTNPPPDADKPPPRFSVAGTVYPSFHEPDLCEGVDGEGQ